MATPALIPFHFDTHAIQVHLDDNGNPWWVLQDICAVLALSNPSKAADRLKPSESTTLTFSYRGQQELKMLLVNEQGLYRLIMRSNKPEAERFQDWVFQEVLPQIRKTGQYSLEPSLEELPPAPSLLPSPVLQLPSPQETLGTLYQCRAALQDLGCFDDRDTITFAAYVRCVAATAMQPLLPPGAAASAAPDSTQPAVWTMSMRLQYLRYPLLTGAEGEGNKIRIGSLAKKTYETTYNEAPPKLWDFVKGQQRQVNGYPPERVHILDQAIEAILGAPRLQVVAPS